MPLVPNFTVAQYVSNPSLIVFTELLLRIMDIQDSDKNTRWMIRPCELQLVTKISGIFNANKQ